MAILNNRRLETARFRGVTFIVSQHSVKSGRRLAEHVFPGARHALQEDVGRLDRTYELTAHIMADTPAGDQDLPDKYRQLVAAMEVEGPAELYHPWIGPVWVVAKPAQIEESLDRRRQIRLKLSFVEVPRLSGLALEDSLLDLTEGALAAVSQAISTAFDLYYQFADMPSFVRAALGEGIGTVGVLFESARYLLRLPAPGARLLGDVALTLHRDGPALADDPNRLAGLLAQGRTAFVTTALPPTEALRALGDVFGAFAVTAPPVPAPTPARRRQIANHLVLGGAVRASALAASLVVVLRGTFADREAAFAARDLLAGWLDGEQRLASARQDDPTFTLLRQLERTLLARLTTQTRALGGRRTVVLSHSAPGLVAAYRELGDARRDIEFARLNKVLHPGLIPAGVTLQIPAN